MKRRELQTLSLDLKWTSEPLFADFGPHMDLALTTSFFGYARAFARVVDPAF
jgi:hypothetical protein